MSAQLVCNQRIEVANCRTWLCRSPCPPMNQPHSYRHAVPSIHLRRAVATIVVLGFTAVAVVLLFSDRAPGVLNLVRDLVVGLGRRIERTWQIDLIDRADIPGTRDEIGHVILWGTGMLVIGLALRKRVPITITAILLAGVSLLSEYGQSVLSTTRTASASDAVANVIGIGLAAVLLGAVTGVARLIFGDDRHFSRSRNPANANAGVMHSIAHIPPPRAEAAPPPYSAPSHEYAPIHEYEPTREIPAVKGPPRR